MARAALAACLDLVGGDQAAPGVLGAAAASLAAVEVARLLWRRHHPEGPVFPPDRWGNKFYLISKLMLLYSFREKTFSFVLHVA
jgi:hypothetical protein